MRLIHLPTFWTILLDIDMWFVIHLGIVSIALRIPARKFDPKSFFFRQRSFENDGRLYVNFFKIKCWKEYAPDGAEFSKDRGFPKKKLKETGNRYLHKFCIETCRAEATHWMLIGAAPFFFLWNRLWVGVFMIFYAVAQNLPLIMIQRYNRIRFRRILRRRGYKS